MRRLLASAALLLAAAPAPAPPLRIIAVDVEGGAATLFVTPHGHGLLIDTGWPAGMGGGVGPSSAERIAAAARAAGLKRIDQVLITHYHLDHVGGLAELMRLIPVGTMMDHGPNREAAPADPARRANAPVSLYPAYLATIAGHPHRVLAPGDRIALDGLALTVTNADGATLQHGPPGATCAALTGKEADGGEENARSVGVVATWGRARVLALGDTTWNVEGRLACPRDVIGPIDLMLVTHHGSALSGNPALLNAVRPRVAVIANGPVKGGDAAVFDAVRASGRLAGLWQLHAATRSPDRDDAPGHIANLAGGADGANLEIDVARDGTVEVLNGRTGLRDRYPGAPQ